MAITYGVNLAITGTVTKMNAEPSPPALDTQVVTVGVFGDEPERGFGFSVGDAYGAIADGTFDVKGGAAISGLAWSEGSETLYFDVVGEFTNDGWTTIKIGNTSYNRADAVYYDATGGATYWAFTAPTNPFGAESTETTVTFT